ncbi:hypothetical protein CSC94_16420 [Zhengella mangrovi]|uniref:Uncharacterized protein n=1 Tax=Zhengella mangrovi TaxID=1982044 RepID=A0A2G1QK43_9HYPH|nr:hypothetical protein [Zhengella mangrovi]PHP65905.1 hypothetical protein CSC94_16420 [Zhengella mangrovi]
MALTSDAAMMLFYDIEGDTADHDDWHSREHFHERLSVPGFLRATRWIALESGERYMVSYEVSDVDVATSKGYLDRLNDPTPWTSEMMPRFRGMVRGFCHVTASAGFGLGAVAAVLRFHPEAGREDALSAWLAGAVLQELVAGRGMVSAYLMRPAPPPPMTREQALRGQDKVMPWLVVATAYDRGALDAATDASLGQDALIANGATPDMRCDLYGLHYTATADEAARSRPLAEQGRGLHPAGAG